VSTPLGLLYARCMVQLRTASWPHPSARRPA